MGVAEKDIVQENCPQESGVSGRLDPSPEHDAGHYVDLPPVRNGRAVEVAEGEVFEKVVIMGGGHSGTMPFDNMIVGAGAKVSLVMIVLPGLSVDLPLAVDIVGEGAEVTVSGLYLCGGDEKVRLRTEVRHRVPSCTSYQLFNGVASGHSDVKFYGKIVVAPEAQKTEAYQTNHNLIVSEHAAAEAKPQLEIYADDVKCSHGATVGQLSEDEQFYMRSRGIPEVEAKVLQMISFIAPVLANVKDSGQKDSISSLVEEEIRRLV